MHPNLNETVSRVTLNKYLKVDLAAEYVLEGYDNVRQCDVARQYLERRVHRVRSTSTSEHSLK
jgi:hypothetical protein